MSKQIHRFLSVLLTVALLSGCQPKSCILEPNVTYIPTERCIRRLPSTFTALSLEEAQTDWGKQLKLGDAFALEFDLYRAITCYKSALVLMPRYYKGERRLQTQYSLVLCYYLGGKYREAVDVFEDSRLSEIPDTFPGFKTVLILLYDSYLKLCEDPKARAIYKLIEQYYPETAGELDLSVALRVADFETIEAAEDPDLDEWLSCYCSQAKSVKKAQILNALLPGAGYAYVGQTRTAITAVIVNALFIAATYEFFHHDNVPAGIITASLETGWYFGGINGAGLAAKTYNEELYNATCKECMIKRRLFPVLMFETAF